VAIGHPIAEEALALTQQYIEVRFGGAPFGEAERRAFAARVRGLKQPRAEREAA